MLGCPDLILDGHHTPGDLRFQLQVTNIESKRYYVGNSLVQTGLKPNVPRAPAASMQILCKLGGGGQSARLPLDQKNRKHGHMKNEENMGWPRVVHVSDGPAGRVGSGHDFAGLWRVSTSDFLVFLLIIPWYLNRYESLNTTNTFGLIDFLRYNN